MKSGMQGYLSTIGLVFMAGMLLSACNYPGLQPSQDPFDTATAKTISAPLTLTAAASPMAPQSTDTPPPGEGNGTLTPQVSPTSCRDEAKFDKDVTIPDNTRLDPGENFEKIWRLENTGTCVWTTSYAIVYESGNMMEGPSAKPLPQRVAPGETVEISLDLTAPSTNGTHKSNWMLRNDRGGVFGLGSQADKPFWVQIVVGPTPTPKPTTVYSFLNNYCQAVWTSAAGTLDCPGSSSDNEGYVLKLGNPKMENGVTENEPALYTHPQKITDGVIGGSFPEIEIREGDHLKTVLGCLYEPGGSACNVKFQITYAVNGGTPLILGQWTELYDGTIRKVDIDLAAKGLAGKSVSFSLVVLANGSPTEDKTFWLMPRIEGPER